MYVQGRGNVVVYVGLQLCRYIYVYLYVMYRHTILYTSSLCLLDPMYIRDSIFIVDARGI